jgi:hypothetical protein
MMLVGAAVMLDYACVENSEQQSKEIEARSKPRSNKN